MKNIKWVRGKLCLFEATYSEGQNGYPPSLKLDTSTEMTDTAAIKGAAAAEIATILKAAQQKMEYRKGTISEAIAENQMHNEDVYVQARLHAMLSAYAYLTYFSYFPKRICVQSGISSYS